MTYPYGTAATWDEWYDEWRDSGSELEFVRWFCRQVWPSPQVTASTSLQVRAVTHTLCP